MTLEAAEYEGEACIQVTVRTQETDSTPPVAPQVSKERTGPGDLSEFKSSTEALMRQLGGRNCAIGVIEIDQFDAHQLNVGLEGARELSQAVSHVVARELDDDGAFTRLDNSRFLAAWLCDDEAANQIRAEQVRAAVEKALFEIDAKTQRCTVSVAVTTIGEESDISDAANSALAILISSRAPDDTNKLYWDTTSTGQDSEEVETDDARRMLSLINAAIENQSFVLLFQPIISLRGDSDEHYEVFLRLPDESGEQILPTDFLDLAIEHGVAGKIDRWVILQSIKMLSVHRSKGHNTRLTVNLTANSITDSEFIQWLGVAIKAARLPSDAVIFQVTEADAAAQVRQTREFLKGLEAMQCRASLSRFGAHETSMELLRHLPVEFVKIEGSIVLDLDKGKSDIDIISMIRELQSHGKLTIVPMVESATLLSTLWQAGANYIQGHYLQEPSAEMDYDFSTDS